MTAKDLGSVSIRSLYKVAAQTTIIIPVSVVVLTHIVGTILSGVLSDVFGRKIILILSACVALIGWVLLFTAECFSKLMAGRLFCGLGNGLGTPVAYMLLSEVALVRYRGTLSVIITLVVNFGSLLTAIGSALMPLRWLIVQCGSPFVVFLALCYFVPESPLWLTKRGCVRKSQETLKWLRGDSYDMNEELKELREITSNLDGGLTVTQKISQVASPSVLKPLGLVTSLFVIQV